MPLRLLTFLFSTLVSASLLSSYTAAYEGGSRLRATGGVHQVEGSAGGGLVPWAVIGGYGQRGEWSTNAFASYLTLDDYTFNAIGVSVGFSDRIEFSYAQHTLDISDLIGPVQDALAVTLPDDELSQDAVGVKVRLFNNLIYDTWPQISAGLQYKRNKDFDIPEFVGAVDDNGTDFYLSGTKLWLSGLGGYPFLLNVTARYTNGNQLGLLGYGGDANENEEWMGELSAGLLLGRGLVVGAEYRQKPDNLNLLPEDDWKDVFIAWFPNKQFSITAAYAQLGNIAILDDQSGFYISVQGTL